jgi:hypothetical protein
MQIKPHESFTVERFDDDCSVCEKLRSIGKAASRKRDDTSGPASGSET